MNRAIAVLASAFAMFLVTPVLADQDDPPYKEGSVWHLSFIKVKAQLYDEYFRDVLPNRKRVLDEYQKQGLILSHKILSGSASNESDWDVLLLVEYKNWAALDGLDAKTAPIDKKVFGDRAQTVQLLVKRSDLREVIGQKIVQELLPK